MAVSGAKLRLRDFLATTKIGETYSFELPGNSLMAENHVQNMRVHLSRVKKKYKANNKPFTEFKISIKEIVPVTIKSNINGQMCELTGCRVTITRAQPGNLDQHFSDFQLG